jgi:hypothetical protein
VQTRPVLVALVLVLTLAGCSAPQHTGDGSGGGGSSAANHDPELGDPALAVLGKYAVSGNDLTAADVPKAYAAVWHRFASLFPASTHPEITHFVAIDADASDDIDGALEPDGTHPGESYLALDVTGSDTPDELDRTMIHEFTHLFTLRASQVDDTVSEDDCPLYDNGGCPLPGSYLEAWETDFWPDAADPSFSESDRARDRRYTKSEFVTDYAATNPDEDIAETFASWVVDDVKDVPGTVRDRKLHFFEAYPELVQLKADILSAL